MVTDKNWFKENILCLLSNAVKYSHGGKVSLTITHVTGNLQVHVPWEEENEGKKQRDEVKENVNEKDKNGNKNENESKLSNGTILNKSTAESSRLPSYGNYPNTYADTDADTDTDADAEADILTDVSTNGISHVHIGSSSLPAPQFFSQSMVDSVLSELHTVNIQTTTDEQDPCLSATNSYPVCKQMEMSTSLSDGSQDSIRGNNRLNEGTSDSTIMITIEDEGIGISEDARENIFQPFKQVQRLAGGTGLGLFSLSKRIKALKGSRGIKSREDGKQGCVFWFAIPYKPDYEIGLKNKSDSFITTPVGSGRHSLVSDSSIRESFSSGSRKNSSTENTVVDGSQLCNDTIKPSSTRSLPNVDMIPAPPIDNETVRTLRFLVVDDSPSILKVLGRALISKKYLVETADNGSIGLNLLIEGYDDNRYDVVLMDLQMPVMDGIESVRRYREFESSKMTMIETDIQTDPGPLETIEIPQSVNSEDQVPAINSNTCHTIRHTQKKKILIIGMSANSDEETKNCALAAGMNYFLPKPFSIGELLRLLHYADPV